MAIDLNQCDQACFGCIKSYKSKHSLKPGQQFQIRCDGIPKDHIPLPVLNTIPVKERSMARAMVDPVEWAAQTLDWHCFDPDGEVWLRKNPDEYWAWKEANPDKDILGHSRYHRPYQAEMLRCTSKRKVFRVGRQSGKCLVSGTLIQMADGTHKAIEDIQDGDLVVSITDDYKSVVNKAYRACNGTKPTYRITLMDGREIEATGNHPFLSRKRIGRESTGNRRAIFQDEWLETTKLTNNDYLAVPSTIILNTEDVDIPDYALTVLGCLIADGNITGNNCRFSNGNSVILNAFKEGVENFGCSLEQYESDKSIYDFHIIGSGVGKRHLVKDWMRNLKLQGLDSHQKFIPDNFMSMSNKQTARLLAAMFGCDGWASIGKDGSPEIGYSTVSEKLAFQIISLLARFGIYASCQNKIVKLNDKKYYSRQITITRKQSIENFKKHIGILGKEEALEHVYAASQKKNSSPKTEAYEDNDITFIRIRSIEYIGEKMTWDLTVPETHNFIANNIVTHNTETLVISMLFSLFTKPGVPDDEGFEIILITPYQSQIDLIFARMRELIKGSIITANSISRSVKAPTYAIELYNNSKVRGFTAGTKSGGNAEAVRGQHGHMLVFDEADYLSSGDMDAALSIITNYPNATVWMSSTPSGKRERFFETCHSKRWKEYHFPSSVNPLWNADLEADFREQLTEIGYIHEIEADFGEQEQGVFQNVYVQAAKSDYKYGDIEPRHEWTYTIGVDWNDAKHGTTINVLGFNPMQNQFIVVDRKVISRASWTQMAACQKIAELNRIWRPMAIYVDKGFGSTQIEVLRKYGFDSLADKTKGPTHPDSQLRDIVKAYDFGSTVETRDLFTKNIIKKHAKGFLVESSVRRFESGDIKFSEYDKDLEDQLLGYVIDRVTPTGNAVYKAGNEAAGDHALDALMLSVVAFVLEATPLGKPKYETDIVFSGKFGERKEALIHEGDLVIQSNTARHREHQRNRMKPAGNRTEIIEQKSLLGTDANELPANHISSVSQPRPWAWDGFMHDAPRPKVRTLSQAEDEARARIGLSPKRRTSRPQRKNI